MDSHYSPPKHTILLIFISMILAVLLIQFFKNSFMIIIGLMAGGYTLVYVESLKFLLDKYKRNQITKPTMNLASTILGLPIIFIVGYLLIVRPELT